jgi:mycothiol synthase
MFNEEAEALVGLTGIANLDWVASPWTAPGVVLERDYAVVETEQGELVGYFFVDSDPPHTSVFGIGGVALAHHERGLGTAMVEEIGRRAEVFLPLAPPGERVLWRMGSLADEPRVAALLTAHGFTEVRRFWTMRIAFGDPPEPPASVTGVTFNQLSSGEEPDVYDCLAEAFEDHWGDGISARERWLHTHVDAAEDHDPSLWHVARRADRVVGALVATAVAHEDPAFGHVDLLGVRRDERGQGIGEALLRRSFCQLHERGRTGVMLIVDSESTTGATRLYERVGMTPEPRFSTWERPLV